MIPVSKVSTKSPINPVMDYNKGMKNTHLEHLEDNILNTGTAGGIEVILVLVIFLYVSYTCVVSA